jgi:hypothetical protein
MSTFADRKKLPIPPLPIAPLWRADAQLFPGKNACPEIGTPCAIEGRMKKKTI